MPPGAASEVIEVNGEWGMSLDLNKVEDALKSDRDIKILAFVAV